MAHLTLFLLGSPRLERDHELVEMDTRKAIALLAYLVLTGKAHSREYLSTLLWPDYEPENARAALRRTLSVLRHALDETTLETTWETISLSEGASIACDVLLFRQKLAESRQLKPGEEDSCGDCLRALEEAAGLYQGDFMAGFSLRDSAEFNDWQFYQGEDLRRDLAGVYERLVEGWASRGEFATAIDYARKWMALDPLHEEAHRQLMKLHAWNGDRSAALRQYRECVRILEKELGVAPLEETTQLYQQIVENQLPAPEKAPVPVVPAIPAAVTPSEGAQVLLQMPLVGRALAWSTLLTAYESEAGEGFYVAISGEAGIGKTRLAEELVKTAQARNARVLEGRCYEGETRLAYGPIIEAVGGALSRLALSLDAGRGGEKAKIRAQLDTLPGHWLAEAARLFPDLRSLYQDLSIPSGGDGPAAQAHFFEGLRQMLFCLLEGAVPGILLLDDLQWADQATLELVQYLARRLHGHPLLIIAVWRGEEVLTKLTAEMARDHRGVHIQLPRLKPSDVAMLVQAAGLASLSGNSNGLAERLYLKSEGLPFFVVEYLKALEEGDFNRQEEWDLPYTIRELLRSRLHGVDETAQQLLTTAAVIGRSFDFQTLRAASGRSELETVSGMEKLLNEGLIRERGERAERLEDLPTGEVFYDFAYEPLRGLVYEEASLTRRRLLHRRVAEALVEQSHGRRDPDALAGVIAGHFHMAGLDEMAANYYELAGARAQRLYANAEAAKYFKSALGLGHPKIAALNEWIGDLRTLLGEYPAAINRYEAAAAMAEEKEIARLELKLGNVHHRCGNWDLAVSHYQAAQEHFSPGSAELARLYGDWANTVHRQGKAEEAQSLAQKALEQAELASQAGDPTPLAEAHNVLGILARGRNENQAALYHLECSLEIAQRSENPRIQAAALNNLALVRRDEGDLKEAIHLAENALELCSAQGDRHREAALLNTLADLFYAGGDSERSMEFLKRAVVIFAEIGVEAGSSQPEIWNLSEW